MRHSPLIVLRCEGRVTCYGGGGLLVLSCFVVRFSNRASVFVSLNGLTRSVGLASLHVELWASAWGFSIEAVGLVSGLGQCGACWCVGVESFFQHKPSPSPFPPSPGVNEYLSM